MKQHCCIKCTARSNADHPLWWFTCWSKKNQGNIWTWYDNQFEWFQCHNLKNFHNWTVKNTSGGGQQPAPISVSETLKNIIYFTQSLRDKSDPDHSTTLNWTSEKFNNWVLDNRDAYLTVIALTAFVAAIAAAVFTSAVLHITDQEKLDIWASETWKKLHLCKN